MTCREFFDTQLENKKKCKLLQQMDEVALSTWENETASEYSPGVVLDEEILYQQIVDPTHIAPDGISLLPKSFDVCSSHGLSTNRLAHSSLAEMIRRGVDRAQKYNANFPDKAQRKLWGFVTYSVEEIRKIQCEVAGTRGLFVFDTANEDDISHAEVCQGGVNSKSSSQAQDIRFALYEMAKGNLRSLESFTNTKE